MIKWFFKYGFVLYLFNTVLLSHGKTYSLGYNLFLFLMMLFSLLIVINPKQIRLVLFHKAFNFLLILNLLNLVYWFLFHNFSDYEAGKYLFARAMQFSVISFSIYYNYDYFKERFMKHLVYFIFAIIVLGLIINPDIFSGRYSGLLWNPNMLASLTSIAFASLLFSQKQRTQFDLSLLFLFLIISLSTGSRSVLVAVSLAYLFRYGFSVRNMIYILLASFSYAILVNLQLDTSVNRFGSQDLFNDRLLQFQYAYETFLEKPLFGSGLDKYAYINLDIVPEYLSSYAIAAHNGYLAIFVQYGLVFGLLILGIIFYQTLRIYLKIDKKDLSELFYLYIIIYTLLNAVYESLMTGINEFQTILFWFALALLSYSNFRKANAI